MECDAAHRHGLGDNAPETRISEENVEVSFPHRPATDLKSKLCTLVYLVYLTAGLNGI